MYPNLLAFALLRDSKIYREERDQLSIGKEGKERRKEERISVSLPVSTANTAEVTRDISPSGVYFEANTPFVLGERIGFVIEFSNLVDNLMLKCNGEIVRVENRNSKVGVAVKILESVMESLSYKNNIQPPKSSEFPSALQG